MRCGRACTGRLAFRAASARRRGATSRNADGEDAVRRFRIGISADGWSDLSTRVAEKGIGGPALLQAGLLVEKEQGGAYDRFRNRLMFPIAGIDGQVIGFGGRVMPGDAPAKAGVKYINTPETPPYKKSKVLYGFSISRARPSARRAPPCSSRATSTSSACTRRASRTPWPSAAPRSRPSTSSCSSAAIAAR